MKSPEQPRWCYSAVFIGSSVHVLPIAYCDFENPTVYVQSRTIEKRSKDFEASDFPSCILSNTHFFETSHRNQKKFHDVRKTGDVQQTKWYMQKVLFITRILYTKLKSYSLCYRKAKQYMQKIPSVTGIITSVKTTIYVCNSFNTSFCTKNHKAHSAIYCYTLLHQAARGEGRNSLRKRKDVLASDGDQQRFFIIIIT